MPVKKRRLFYVHGFDPRGAAHYTSLFRGQAQKQLAAESVNYQLEASDPIDGQFDIRFTENGQTTETRYQYLDWTGVVKEYLGISLFGFLKETLQSARWYWREEFRKPCKKIAPTTYMAFWLGYLGVFIPALVMLLTLLLGALQLIDWPVVAVVAVLVVLGYGYLIKRFNLTWLVRSFNLNYDIGEHPEKFMPYIRKMADEVEAALVNDDSDEVLIVCHCFGTSMVNMLLAELANRGRLQRPLSVLTLAQVCPALVWTTPWYQQCVKDSQKLQLTHLDFSSPADGMCIPFYQLYSDADHVVSEARTPRFHKMFSDRKYRRIISKNKLRVHFQYLLASDNPVYFDFFRITAGPNSLLEVIQDKK
ncbi:hypothetical protein [Oceanobacter mangrovi]|uniref:hypothetical protein n=1 Tax=Oceanobacter mangrovi TaxID=2862510 RepID=UPI001C8D5F4C|nr:hypothetical protein [Oceanobacter mangrovi]